MSWSTPADLRAQVQRLWDRGDLLRAAVDGQALAWPCRLVLRAPGASDLSERFEAVREWVRTMADTPRIRIEWRERTHRVQGRQMLPAATFVDTLAEALAWIGRTPAAEQFTALWQDTADAQPALLPWLFAHPLRALDLAERWPRLRAVVAWLQAHPRPGIYLRQVDVPGVDSKFIEAHRGVLGELFDLALSAPDIDAAATGAAQFARRYGFLDKPLRIRLRLLDPTLPGLPGCRAPADITLDAASFASLALEPDRVFVTENETNFLAFAPVPRTLVVFGAGYGWDTLAAAPWLQRCSVYYWGDIDTHGFAILDQLRSRLAHVRSFLMDRETLLSHRLHWGEEPAPARHDLSRLTPEEAALYDDLRFDRFRARLRLEQERVGYGHFVERLDKVGTSRLRQALHGSMR